MRYALLLAPALVVAVAAAVSCGGSSSETPWPVEPEAFSQNTQTPIQETVTPSIITEEARDAGQPKRQ
jgi:hypothetical protein